MTAARRIHPLTTTVVVGLVVMTLLARDAQLAAAPADESAQHAFRAGVDAARQARWPEARALFEHAYALSPRPVVLINLAGAQARTGRLIDAAKNYRHIIDDSASAEMAPFRKAAAEVLPELEHRIPRVRVRPSESTAADAFEIDGEATPLDRLEAGVPLDPGQHTLVVQRGGVERARVLFSLAEREVRDIPLVLPKPVPLPAPPALPSPSRSLVASGAGRVNLEPVAAESDESRTRERAWWASPWTWTAVGAVLVATTVTVVLLANEHREQPFSGNIPPGQIPLR